jgi:hypothetical protein
MRKSLIYGCGLYGMSDVADCIIADLQSTGPEGAKEARKLHFVLQAAAGSDASSSAASPVRRRRRPAKKRPATTASGVASTSTTNDDDRLLEQTQSPEWNRGLEMWKHWLGLPNSYYADRVPADGSRDVDVDASSRADVTFGER